MMQGRGTTRFRRAVMFTVFLVGLSMAAQLAWRLY
jgi:hypothetical protein